MKLLEQHNRALVGGELSVTGDPNANLVVSALGVFGAVYVMLHRRVRRVEIANYIHRQQTHR